MLTIKIIKLFNNKIKITPAIKVHKPEYGIKEFGTNIKISFVKYYFGVLLTNQWEFIILHLKFLSFILNKVFKKRTTRLPGFVCP